MMSAMGSSSSQVMAIRETSGEARVRDGVASLAAEGLSNRQIAEHLFITQATVETHLPLTRT
jgi:DNA-binding NarL/FixJ family response regulator